MAISDYPSAEAAAQAGDPEALAAIAAFVHAVTPIDQIIRTQYPQLIWAINHPELGPILQQAARERWDPARFQGALVQTNWWKSTNEAQRTWQRLRAEDPATASARWFTALNTLVIQAQRLGVTLTDDVKRVLADGFAAEGWDAQRLTQEIIQRATGFTGAGEMGAAVDGLRARSAQYLMPMGEDGAFGWAKQILIGSATEEGFDAYLRDQARARFAGDKTMVAAIDQGVTVAQYFEPLKQQTAQLLELSPGAVDLMDTRWSPMIDSAQADGTRRSMTLSEAAQHIRGLAEWKGTKQAGEQAASVGETLLKTFGEVA